MEDIRKEYEALKRRGRELVGVSKRKVGEFLILEVNVTKAKLGDKKYSELTPPQRQNYEDLLYLSSVQEGNPQIIYAGI